MTEDDNATELLFLLRGLGSLIDPPDILFCLQYSKTNLLTSDLWCGQFVVHMNFIHL